MRNTGYIFYIIVFLLLILFPLAGLAIPGSEPSEELYAAEKRELAPIPSLIAENGTPNVSYLGDMGDWFEDHMAFRDRWITADSLLKKYTVGSDADDKVIIGSDGWLYYHGTENDFLGRELMSDRELFDAAHNLKLMQQYIDEKECRFLFVAAVNKNSLFPDNMPYTYIYSAQSNARNLMPYLDDAGVRYADLHSALANSENTYFQTDTHWNGKGALIGYNEILDGLGLQHDTYSGTRWITRTDHVGDLEEMLFPAMPAPETDYYLDIQATYSFVDIPDSMRDPLIRTTNQDGTGKLYMFRDSFGDALIPLLSQHFAQATYSMYRPWNLPAATETRGTDVVVEIVERNLEELINRPAILPAPEIEEDFRVIAGPPCAEYIHAERDGPYVCISGRVSLEDMRDTARIAVRAEKDGETRTYEPFYTSNKERLGNSFYLYLPADAVPANTVYIEVCVDNTGDAMRVVFADTIHIETEENEGN